MTMAVAIAGRGNQVDDEACTSSLDSLTQTLQSTIRMLKVVQSHTDCQHIKILVKWLVELRWNIASEKITLSSNGLVGQSEGDGIAIELFNHVW